tara:strand:+ start:59 stop:379 length:321 start_codon:yes stop_codon:yes gene_type:complete
MKIITQIFLILFSIYCILTASSNMFYGKVAFDDRFTQSFVEAAKEENKTENYKFLLAGTSQALVLKKQINQISIFTISLSTIVIFLSSRSLYLLKRRGANQSGDGQ